MTDYHTLSLRINGVTVDLDGVDKQRFTDQAVITLFQDIVTLMRWKGEDEPTAELPLV